MKFSPYTRVLLAFVLLSCTGLAACGVPFEPYWRIKKFRVLAIKSDPITLKPGQSATLSALISNQDSSPITYTWEWCPFRTSDQNEFACPFTKDELVALLTQSANMGEQNNMNTQDGMGPNLPPGFDLGQLIPDFTLSAQETATFAYPLTTEIILGLCKATQGILAAGGEGVTNQASISNCDRGYEITVRLIAKNNGTRLVSAKRLTLWTGRDEFDHKNPEIASIQIRPAKTSDFSKIGGKLPWFDASLARQDQWYDMPMDAPTPILEDMSFELRSIVNPELVETFQKVAPVGSGMDFLPPEQEAVLYRWFTGAGDLDKPNPLYKEGVSKKSLEDASITMLNLSYNASPDANEAIYGAPQKDDWDLDGVANAKDNCPSVPNASTQSKTSCTFSVWSVVRDGRLGVDWMERRIEVITP